MKNKIPILLLISTFSFLVCCRKESNCSTYFQGQLNGIQTERYCLGTETLDNDTLTITNIRPNQQIQPPFLGLFIRCKKSIGTQQLDTAINNNFSSRFFILYKGYDPNRKTYSLYSSETNGTIQITNIDEDAKTVTGSFNGLLCEIASVQDTLRVSNAVFTSKYR